MSEGKISFSFGAKHKAAPQPSGPSNLELLMAKAKAPTAGSSKAKPGTKPKPGKPAVSSLFGDDDDGPPRPPPTTETKKPRPPVNLLSRAERKAQEAALQLDPSVFDYDGAYEAMKRSEAAVEAAKQAEDAERKPKYIEAFLQAARTRKLDELAAKEKMLEREREAEGDEFADKEAFVTEAYKKQMEEVRVAREEEKKREEAMKNSSKGPGLTSLYKTMLDANEAKHAAAVASASAPSGPSLAIRPPTTFDDEEEYDPLLAREAAASGSNPAPVAGTTSISSEGRAIEINDDGEVVNKRSLFKAGLNIVKKPKPETPSLLANSARTRAAEDKPYVSRAVGAAAGYHERMARERARLAEQLREQEEKKRAEAERRRQEEEEAARRRREGVDGEAERKRLEAKERFLARKRAREEEAEARKKAKGG